MESLELTIIHNLLYNKEYFIKIIPFLKKSCFKEQVYQFFCAAILKLYSKNNEQPTPELVIAEVQQHKCNAELAKRIQDVIRIIKDEPREQKVKSLVNTTQDYFQRVFTENSVNKLLTKIDNQSKIDMQDVIDLRDSVSFSIEEKPFYDYLAKFQERGESYKEKKDRFSFPLAALNHCTNGGMLRKSMTVVMASTGGGKSIFLCNAAAHSIKQGYNVLYVTCEMSVEEIAKRIDANLLNTTQDSMTNGQVDVKTLRERLDSYYKDHDNWGHLFLKEYSAACATVVNIEQDIEELERVNNLKIDLLVVDYLNLMTSTRFSTKNSNTYTIVKAVAEELRGVGQDRNIPILTATQSNRSALSKENRIDGGLELVSESIGLPQTADFMFNIIEVPDQTWKANKWRLLKILKNRWGDPSVEYIKVRLDTRFARFSNVEDCMEGMKEKPTLVEDTLTKDNDSGILEKSKTDQSKPQMIDPDAIRKELF